MSCRSATAVWVEVGAAKARAGRLARFASVVGPLGRLPCAARACPLARASQCSRRTAPTATAGAASGQRLPRCSKEARQQTPADFSKGPWAAGRSRDVPMSAWGGVSVDRRAAALHYTFVLHPLGLPQAPELLWRGRHRLRPPR